MILGLFGSMCIGLIWGWLMGRIVVGFIPHSFNIANLLMGSTLLSIQTYLFEGLWAPLFFWGGTMSGLIGYSAWNRIISARANRVISCEGGIQ